MASNRPLDTSRDTHSYERNTSKCNTNKCRCKKILSVSNRSGTSHLPISNDWIITIRSIWYSFVLHWQRLSIIHYPLFHYLVALDPFIRYVRVSVPCPDRANPYVIIGTIITSNLHFSVQIFAAAMHSCFFAYFLHWKSSYWFICWYRS